MLFVPSTLLAPNLPCGCRLVLYIHCLLIQCNSKRSYFMLVNYLLVNRQCWFVSCRVHRKDNNLMIRWSFPLLTYHGGRGQYLWGLLFGNCRRYCPWCCLSYLVLFCLLCYLPSIASLMQMGKMIILYRISFVPNNGMCKNHKSSFTKIVTFSTSWKVVGGRVTYY
jgi:hypothetical protein